MGMTDWVTGRGSEGFVPEGAPEMDIEAAKGLVAEDELLRQDEYTAEVLASGGVIERNGEQIQLDLGNFLSARRNVLERAQLEQKDPAAYDAAMVVHSASTRGGTVH